jgi:rhamnose utilization protein RhaD (predicted bifunctional aldolase and dehydrogenase)
VKSAAQRKLLATRSEGELMPLRELSARLGSNPLLVQASNGNTSIKLDGTLWIKASGRCLSQAMREELLIPLDLAEVRASIEHDTEIAPRDLLRPPVRPSVETAMHAILPHRVVIHVHSINAIAWAIRLDGRDQLRERLASLHWQWIPYAPSGIPLARAIEKSVANASETDVFVLANHGLVICGHDCHTAEKLLDEVERRLAIVPRRFPKADSTVLTVMARLSRWQFPDDDSLHALGTDALSRQILKGGILYPCQTVFLGRTMPVLSPAAVISKFSQPGNGSDQAPLFIVVERCGVMLNENVTSAERATLTGLAQVTQRIDESVQLRYLKDVEVSDVLSNNVHGHKTGRLV